ncbi:alpha/beta fold hydrolase [Nocardia sp. NPDC052566]|uniref:alpha/beta fold hydrolase n=1 Tax=Nocardia sp. NPDC052566 TaxID=3364330 RepID=UPI0037C4F4EC
MTEPLHNITPLPVRADVATETDGDQTPRPDRRWTVAGAGGDLAVFEWGSGAAEPLVLVHGLTDTHRVWATVAALLADGFRVITYDVRGHGKSATSADPADYRLSTLAEDFFAVIDAASPRRPVHVCGHGWGGVQLWEAVCDPRANTRIASFTAISGPNLDHLGLWLRVVAPRLRHALGDPGALLGLALRSVVPTMRSAAPSAQSLRSAVPSVQLLRSAVPSARAAAPLVRSLRSAVPSVYSLRSAVPIRPVVVRRMYTPRVRTWLVERLGGISPVPARIAPSWRGDAVAGARIAQANLLHHLRSPRVRRTAVPVQLLVNTTDLFVPPAAYDSSDRWVDRLWRCAVPADHWLPVTEPLLVAEALANFVDDLRADRAAIGQRRR